MIRQVCPLCACPDSSRVSMASGMEAAEVLPWLTMSRATTTSDGSLRALNMASVIRLFAWCGTKTSRSSGFTPATSIASAAVLAMV
jgi:hypothetical protein